jgi:hypothetical protein
MPKFGKSHDNVSKFLNVLVDTRHNTTNLEILNLLPQSFFFQMSLDEKILLK